MGIANKLNTGRKQTVKEGIDTKDLEYMSAADYADTKPKYPVHLAGFFLKNGEYGEQVTIIVDDPKTERQDSKGQDDYDRVCRCLILRGQM